MAKQGTKRPERTHVKPMNEQPAVPELQGKIKTRKMQANPLMAGTPKVYHKERPISSVYPVIDTDLGRDNVENDLTAADLQDL